MQQAPGYRLGIVGGLLVALLAAFVLGLLVSGGGGDDEAPATPRRAAHTLVGPSGLRDGVPTGYPRSRDGAIAAVLAYGQVFADPDVLFDRDRRRKALAVIATDRYAATFDDGQSALDQARENLGAGDGAQTVFLGAPVSYEVERYTRDQARVRTWGVSVYGNDSGLVPRSDWQTTTTTLKWLHGSWRIDASHAISGPSPAAARRPTDVRELLDGLARMREPRYAP